MRHTARTASKEPDSGKRWQDVAGQHPHAHGGRRVGEAAQEAAWRFIDSAQTLCGPALCFQAFIQENGKHVSVKFGYEWS